MKRLNWSKARLAARMQRAGTIDAKLEREADELLKARDEAELEVERAARKKQKRRR